MAGHVGASESIQGLETIQGIRLLISIIPAAIGALMFGAFLFYKLDETLLMQIESDLESRRNEAADAPA